MDHIVALLMSSLSRYWVVTLPPVCVCSECERVDCTKINDLTRRVTGLLLLLIRTTMCQPWLVRSIINICHGWGSRLRGHHEWRSGLMVLTKCGCTCRRIRVGEAFGQADSQSIKKPIDIFLIRSSPVLNEFSVAESITCWSRPFHLLTTVVVQVQVQV